MRVNDEVIVKYFNRVDCCEYSEHWVFSNIEEGEKLFEEPTYEEVDLVKDVHSKMKEMLDKFKPLNQGIFNKIFPEYEKLLDDTEILLIVGCPEPYDAMFREYKDREYVIFDLIRFSQYVKQGLKIEELVNQILTHEFVHKCLHQRYRINDNASYTDILNYITFNEGFAHLLAYKENITDYDFNKEAYDKIYEKSKSTLISALGETDTKKQRELIMKSNSGQYWEKFAAISGKLYLGKNIGCIEEIYNNGWDGIIQDILA